MEASCHSQPLERLWVDSGYTGKRFAQVVADVGGATALGSQATGRRVWGFVPTLGCGKELAWLVRYRRLSKDDELLPEVSESMIYASMVRLMLYRLSP